MTVTVALFTELGWPGLRVAAGPGDSESCLGLGLRFVSRVRCCSHSASLVSRGRPSGMARPPAVPLAGPGLSLSPAPWLSLASGPAGLGAAFLLRAAGNDQTVTVTVYLAIGPGTRRAAARDTEHRDRHGGRTQYIPAGGPDPPAPPRGPGGTQAGRFQKPTDSESPGPGHMVPGGLGPRS